MVAIRNWFFSVYSWVRYRVDPRFRAEVDMYQTLIERSMMPYYGCTCNWAVQEGRAVYDKCQACKTVWGDE